jgi:hypothetical protein
MEPGVRYRRYAGVDLNSGVVQILEGEEPASLPLEWLAVILGLGLAVVGLVAVRRGAAPAIRTGGGGAAGGAQPPGSLVPAAVTARDRRRRLVLEVARIDETLDSAEGAERERLLARREELVALLQNAEGG